MNRSFTAAVFISLICIYLTGCSSAPSCLTVVPPEINLTGEKTVIERQIIGDYMELEKDAWTVSSVKTPVTGREGSIQASGDPELIKSIKVREFHAGRVRAYKSEGVIGENSSGFVSYVEGSAYESSPELKKVLMIVIDEENKARRDIFVKTLARSGGKAPSGSEVESFGRIFAEEQRALAQKGDWIQDNSGKWARKR